MMYVNKRNGKVARLVEQDEVRKTCMLEFEDGKSTTVASTTFKRWYKAIEEQEEVEVEPLIDLDNPITEAEAEELEMVGGDEALEQAVVEPTEEVVNDDICAETDKEIAEQAKHKAKDAKKKVSKRADNLDMFKTLVTKHLVARQLEVYQTSNLRKLDVKYDGKTVARVYIGDNKCTTLFTDKYAPKALKPSRVRNCRLANAYDISYQDLDKKFSELFSEILTKEEE